jgi:hypothetical protein
MGEFNQAKYQSRIREIAQRLGFFVVDPLPELAARRNGTSDLFIAYDRNHPSAAGHRVIGQTIFEYLQQHQLTPVSAQDEGRATLLSSK